MKLKLKDIQNDDERWPNIQLSKLTGHHIKEVEGYITDPWGDEPLFNITRIILGNGRTISVNGEHDVAYIESEDKDLNLDNETLEDLQRQQDEEE
jgi:hypothetical protein